MSRSAEGRHGSRQDDGFSLIEIIVALGVLSIVLVALLPQLVVGIQASGTAREVSQAKGVAQGQLERMRNLPFHIAPAAGNYVDVLDYYYRDRIAPGTAPVCMTGSTYRVLTPGSTGYVDGGARCDYEPATGAFYRTVSTVGDSSGMSGYTLVVDTQFLSGATPPLPVSPLTGYDTQMTGKDSPASSQIGTTVTVLQNRRGTIRPVTSYTQIAQRLSSTNRVRSEADVRVVDIGSITEDRVPLSLSAGLVNLTGAVSFASTAGANLAATSANLATGEQGSGASSTLSAPPNVITANNPAVPGSLSTGGCSYACWGQSSVPGLSLSADNARPTVGSTVSPAQVLLSDATNSGISFGNSLGAGYRLELALAPPLVRLDSTVAMGASGLSGCAVSTTGSLSHLSASGYLRTTDQDTTSEVESCAVARATPLELLPTTFAPHGVVRVELVKASASCLVQTSAHAATASYDYGAVVEYWNGTGYTTAATVVPGQTSDPLAAIPLTTSVGNGLTLGDYISSWSTLTLNQVVKTQTAGVAQVKLPGIVRIVSQPVRPDPDPTVLPGDPTSAVSLTVGALGCKTEDAR